MRFEGTKVPGMWQQDSKGKVETPFEPLILVATVAMIGFIAVLTASVASVFVKTERREETDEIVEILTRIERTWLRSKRDRGPLERGPARAVRDRAPRGDDSRRP